jgi:hypothetical protein
MLKISTGLFGNLALTPSPTVISECLRIRALESLNVVEYGAVCIFLYTKIGENAKRSSATKNKHEQRLSMILGSYRSTRNMLSLFPFLLFLNYLKLMVNPYIVLGMLELTRTRIAYPVIKTAGQQWRRHGMGGRQAARTERRYQRAGRRAGPRQERR